MKSVASGDNQFPFTVSQLLTAIKHREMFNALPSNYLKNKAKDLFENFHAATLWHAMRLKK